MFILNDLIWGILLIFKKLASAHSRVYRKPPSEFGFKTKSCCHVMECLKDTDVCREPDIRSPLVFLAHTWEMECL